MKVYLLSLHHWDHGPIRGAYSTLARAQIAASEEMDAQGCYTDTHRRVFPVDGTWEQCEEETRWWSAPRGVLRLTGWTYIYEGSGPTKGVWGIEEMEVDGL